MIFYYKPQGGYFPLLLSKKGPSGLFRPPSCFQSGSQQPGPLSLLLSGDHNVQEGFYRELVSKIQTMRKEAGFEVMDHIYVYADNNDTITGIIKKYADQLKGEVLADSITLGQMAGHAKEWNINGETVMLGVAKVTR